jgi:hypothetical protein
VASHWKNLIIRHMCPVMTRASDACAILKTCWGSTAQRRNVQSLPLIRVDASAIARFDSSRRIPGLFRRFC